MKTLCLVCSSANPSVGAKLTVTGLRKLYQLALATGLKPYPDDNFRGWISPYTAHDVLSSFNVFTDIYGNYVLNSLERRT